jgi:hypothetical protein
VPSKSFHQHNLMAAVAASPSLAREARIPRSVGREFVAADTSAGRYTGRRASRKARPYRGQP